MKKLFSLLLAFTLLFAPVLSGCSEGSAGGADTTEPSVTDGGGTPEETAKHELSVSEVKSILVSNDLKTNVNSMWSSDGLSYHGGMQMRLCRTERGIYTAFARDFGAEETTGIQEFYVAKVDNDGNVSILYFGEFKVYGNEIDVNIGHDINGDVIATVIGPDDLGVFVFDKDTDEVSEYVVKPNFAGESPHDYTMAMFDFENRKIYAFYPGYGANYVLGNYQIDWFTFDLETGKWSDTSTFASFTEIGRHCYMFPFPDGNGGAYIASCRSERSGIVADKLTVQHDRQYIWDRIDLFHIPDLTSSENVTYTPVQLGDESRGLDGIWTSVSISNGGDATVDSNGYMHITYRYSLHDYLGTNAGYDDEYQYRHAIYDGMECIYNEKLDLEDDTYTGYKPMIRQSSDGKLHMIAVKCGGDDLIFEFYSAEDELGKNWKFEKSHTVNGITAASVSLTDTRDGSIQDDVLGCFYYRTHGNEYNIYNGYTSANVLHISLDDYSITEPIDILENFDIVLDPRHDKRIPHTDEQIQIISTENGTYAAIITNFKYGDSTEEFVIAKIDNNKKLTVLASDTFKTQQDKYLTMTEGLDGKIYVCLPSGRDAHIVDSGRHAYVIDTVTDEVTHKEM
ncbi:MAG: hypothetical protein IJF13_00925, partial [Clostridia bacterium]|nr:hypothetical protein [Clostridia bacterium]